MQIGRENLKKSSSMKVAIEDEESDGFSKTYFIKNTSQNLHITNNFVSKKIFANDVCNPRTI